MNHNNKFLQYMQDKYSINDLENMAQHGSRNGFEDLIYIDDVANLFCDFGDEILDLITEDENYTSMTILNKNTDYRAFLSDLGYLGADLASIKLIENLSLKG